MENLDRQVIGDALDRAHQKLEGLGHILGGLLYTGVDGGLIGMDSEQLAGVGAALSSIIDNIAADMRIAQDGIGGQYND